MNEIIEKTRIRIDESEKVKSLDDLKKEVLKSDNKVFPFKNIFDDEISVIAEISDLTLIEDMDTRAISLITQADVFTQPLEYLKDFSADIPVLRKDYIIDEYMIWESRAAGFSAILLKASVLNIVQLKQFMDLAYDLGLSSVVEVCDGDEIRTAMMVGAEIISVINSDENIENAVDLRRCAGGEVIFIADGGVKTKDDIIKLKENNVNAILLDPDSIKSID